MSERGKILLSGFYGAKNAGDEAILSSILHLVSENFSSEKSVTVASTDPEHTQRLHGDVDTVPQFNRKHMLPFLRELRDSEYLFIGGGGVIGEPRIIRWAIMIVFARLFRTKVALIGVGVEEVSHPINRLVLRWALNQTQAITVRDRDSAQLLENMGVDDPITTLSDPAFVPTSEEPIDPPVDSDEEFILVSLREVQWADVDVSELASGLDAAVDALDINILFVPFHSCGSVPDEEFARSVASTMDEDAHLMEQSLNFRQLNHLSEEAELVVGMRLHSIILGARRKTKVVGIAYHPKCESILNQLGDHSVMWCNDISSDELSDKIQAQFDSPSDQWSDRVDEIQQQARQLLPTITSAPRTLTPLNHVQLALLLPLLPLAIVYNVLYKLRGGAYTYRPNEMVGNN